MPLGVLDLFSGCGGLSCYFQRPQFDILLSIDNWQPALDTISKNKSHKVLCADLSQLEPKDLNLATNVDVIIGGFPCQGFSSAGRRKIDDPRNTLFLDYIKYVKHFKPRLCLIENVVGLLTMRNDQGDFIKDIITSQLEQLGYHVKMQILNSAQYLVPQRRRRVIFIASKHDNNFTFPEPSSSLTRVKECIDARDTCDEKLFLSEKAITGINRKKQVSKERKAGWGAQFIDLEKPCYTIPARYWKDGYDALIKYDEKTIRRLSVNELARIQTFPETYLFSGTKKEIIMQIGNAVPCLLGKVLGESIHQYLVQ